ncbi:hypothetical protein [Thalassoglobus sp.]|uniref:hypothetical protein n=1 Tax=Thalassoglobus sp. TaxID=2795869 RepID=UPI003AA91EFB
MNADHGLMVPAKTESPEFAAMKLVISDFCALAAIVQETALNNGPFYIWTNSFQWKTMTPAVLLSLRSDPEFHL